MRWPTTLVVTAFFVTGCKSDPPNVLSATAETAQSACESGCAWDVDCNGTDLQECIDDCVADAEGWIRQDALEEFQGCVAKLTCDDNPDDCGAYVKPLDVHVAFSEKCTAQLAECEMPAELDCTVDFDPDDYDAGAVRFATPEIVDELSACLDGADCDARTSCMLDVYATYNVH
jgi:hypothetical protein